MKTLYATTLMAAFGLMACDNSGSHIETSNVQDVSATSTAPADPWHGNTLIKAIYPDTNAIQTIPLDYISFAFIEGGGMSAVPLPPFLKQATAIHVGPTPLGYAVTAGNELCASKIIIKNDNVVLATLDPKNKSNRATFSADKKLSPQGKDIEILLDPEAKVNYNCAAYITPIQK